MMSTNNSNRQYISFLALLVLVATSTPLVQAFHTTQPVTRIPVLQSGTQLRQQPQNTKNGSTDNNERRGFFSKVRNWVGSTILVGGALPVFAADDATVTTPAAGNIIEMKVSNIEGDSTKSAIIKIQMKPEWAPRGVARFEELVSTGFYNDCRFFRVLPGFISQFGINGDPSVMSKWRSLSLPDDPVKVSNSRGTVVFATAGPNTRTTQIFVNTRQQGNDFLDKQGFSPFGVVLDDGMEIVDKLYSEYGEGAPGGKGPNQGLIQSKGNAYLNEKFPKLSYISSATVQK